VNQINPRKTTFWCVKRQKPTQKLLKTAKNDALVHKTSENDKRMQNAQSNPRITTVLSKKTAKNDAKVNSCKYKTCVVTWPITRRVAVNVVQNDGRAISHVSQSLDKTLHCFSYMIWTKHCIIYVFICKWYIYHYKKKPKTKQLAHRSGPKNSVRNMRS
jgi:hypothetical protein